MRLAGFGNYPQAETMLLQARGDAEILGVVVAQPSLIARGNGRSYGDAALNDRVTLSLLKSDRILAFDESTGLLTCEAGVMLADILDIFVPRGWFVPVTPGTKFVTIGGMLAANVHGKNHHGAGAFLDHVERFTLLRADGQTLTCSRTENPELFAATAGGMGLTGIIVTVSFRLMRIETAYIRQRTRRTANLAETMAAFEQSQDSTYSVAWIDCMASGAALGRSVLYLGEHARGNEITNPSPLMLKPRKTRRVPFYLPSLLLNRWSITAFNQLYYARAREGTAIIGYDQFFYPLDALQEWNRIYGKRGFLQYQCVLPKATSAEGMTALLARIREAGMGSFLAVLKLLGPGGNYLSFPMEGYTLALDFPVSRAVFPLLDVLDAIVAQHGGRIYLAKDARMGLPLLRSGYPQLAAFLALRREVDPNGKFSSLLAKRLELS